MKSILIGAVLSLLGAARVHADTTYNMTFTNSAANPVIGNGSGTFTINSADVITSMDLTFPVLQAYSVSAGGGTYVTGSPGDVFTFTTITAPANGVVTFDPTTDLFGSGTNYRFILQETQSNNPNSGARLTIFGGEPILTNEYTVYPLADGEFYQPFDPAGTWLITASTPTTGPGTGNVAPEPGSVGLALTGFGAACLIIRRRKAHSA